MQPPSHEDGRSQTDRPADRPQTGAGGNCPGAAGAETDPLPWLHWLERRLHIERQWVPPLLGVRAGGNLLMFLSHVSVCLSLNQ